ncbi:MAG: RNA pseudouridine synthase [Planctomycetes bacterium]|nr:RNA pseudouridine synthase [Planctomycetota bacterium]
MRELDVLGCDNHLLAVRKPAGMPVVPDSSADASLFDVARAWLAREFAKPGNVFLGVVHRLDRPVSGVVLFARTSKAAARLSEQWRAHRAVKTYWAVGEGRPTAGEGEHVEHLAKDEARNVVHGVRAGAPGAREARTHWRVLAAAHGRTLYEFLPLTGRPHQLRHCARSLGTPLLGDLKYGAREALADASIALHAVRLRVRHPTLATDRTFACAPPLAPWWDLAHTQGWSEPTQRDEPVRDG